MKPTVLVADSDPSFATILSEALEATGDYVVTTVRTAGGALDAVRLRPFDMVIVDSNLADVPLPALIQTMRATWPAAHDTTPTAADGDRSMIDDDRYAGLVRIIGALQREQPTRAVVITRGKRVIASGGSIDTRQQAELAQLIMDRVATSARLMRLLDEPDGRVALVLEEGPAMRVYAVRVTADVWLTVATSPSLPLGSLRYRTRQAVEEIVAALR